MTISNLFDYGFIAPQYESESLHRANSWVVERFRQNPQAKVCIVLVDGLGWTQLQEASEIFGPLSEVFAQMDSRTTVVPSTTAAALAAFGTGMLPSTNGVVGYEIRHPLHRTAVNQITWKNVDDHYLWHSADSFAMQLGDSVTSTAISHSKYRETVLTRNSLQTDRFIAADTLADRFEMAQQVLHEPGGQYVYLYWEKIDQVGHKYGPDSKRWRDNASYLARQLLNFHHSLPENVEVLVTSDHGMLQVEPYHHVDATAHPEVFSGVELISGEPRFRHLYVSDTDRVPHITERIADFLGERALVFNQEDALAQKIFGGELSTWARQCVGDIIIAMRKTWILVESGRATPNALAMKGHHGSLTPGEMLVPWLIR